MNTGCELISDHLPFRNMKVQLKFKVLIKSMSVRVHVAIGNIERAQIR